MYIYTYIYIYRERETERERERERPRYTLVVYELCSPYGNHQALEDGYIYICMHIYIYMCVCVCVYRERDIERHRWIDGYIYLLGLTHGLTLDRWMYIFTWVNPSIHLC